MLFTEDGIFGGEFTTCTWGNAFSKAVPPCMLMTFFVGQVIVDYVERK